MHCIVGNDPADLKCPGPKNKAQNQEIRQAWATKVSEIGHPALVGAEGAEESQGRKDRGILATYESMATKPCLRKHGCAEGRQRPCSKNQGQHQGPWPCPTKQSTRASGSHQSEL